MARGLGAALVPFLEVVERADFLALHVPLLPETRHLVGVEELRRMKPSAYLINASRGGVVDEAALARALREGWIAGAACDVFEEEPPLRSPLLEAPNVVLTSHIGGIPGKLPRGPPGWPRSRSSRFSGETVRRMW